MLFFNLRNEKGRGNGEFEVHFDPLGSPGTPLVDLTEKAWNQTVTHLRLPGLKIGNYATHDTCSWSLRKLSTNTKLYLSILKITYTMDLHN